MRGVHLLCGRALFDLFKSGNVEYARRKYESERGVQKGNTSEKELFLENVRGVSGRSRRVYLYSDDDGVLHTRGWNGFSDGVFHRTYGDDATSRLFHDKQNEIFHRLRQHNSSESTPRERRATSEQNRNLIFYRLYKLFYNRMGRRL